MKYLGVDLGGTNVAAALISEEGTILRRSSIPTPRDVEGVVEVIAKQVNALLEGETDQVPYVGIGAPGTIEPAEGTIGYWSNLNMYDVPLGRLVAEKTGRTVLVENDANCAAIGEFFAGAGKGTKNMIAITLGTGVGGGAILNGKLYTGSNYAGMEIGHHVIRRGGQRCTCGRLGCFEAYCSATAIIRDARAAMQKAPDSMMWSLAGSLEKVEGRTVTDAAQKGDATAVEVVKNFTDMLGCGVANMVNIFQPDVVCIGGGLANAGDILMKPVQEILAQEDYYRHGTAHARVCHAQLGNDAGLIGAAMIQKYR